MSDTLRTIKTVVAATGLTPESLGGLLVAQRLGERYGAEFHVVHVAEPISAEQESAIPGLAAKHLLFAEKELNTFLGSHDIRPGRTHVLHGSTSEEILRFVSDHHADLLVLGRYGKGGLKRGVIGSIAASIMRKCPCSVCLVEPQHRGEYEHIAVATALSEESHIPIARALEVAHRKGHASISLVHVFSVPQGYHMVLSWEDAVSKLKAAYTEKAQEALAHARRLVPEASDVEVALCIEEGSPAAKIEEIVQRDGIDLLIAAPHTRTGAAKLLLPPMAESVINRVPCTMWAEKTPAKSQTMLDALKKLLS